MGRTLDIHLDQVTASFYNQRRWCLCFSIGVSSNHGPASFNVVAYTTKVEDFTTITWDDSFLIAASTSKFRGGNKFDERTARHSIKFGQTFTLPQDWSDQSPNDDPKAPSNGFLFRNQPMASAILFQTVKGGATPVYFSAQGPLPPGKEILVPKSICRVWLADNIGPGTMVDNYQFPYMDVDMTTLQQAQINLDNMTNWTLSKTVPAPQNEVKSEVPAVPNDHNKPDGNDPGAVPAPPIEATPETPAVPDDHVETGGDGSGGASAPPNEAPPETPAVPDDSVETVADSSNEPAEQTN